MALLTEHALDLERCPHCDIASPNLTRQNALTIDSTRFATKLWVIYGCNTCGGAILANGMAWNAQIDLIYPTPREPVSIHVPERARHHFEEAINTKNSPSASCISSASSVDAMLKSIGYTEGKLFPRIEKAAKDHKITAEMAVWAHEVRMDANDERHADLNSELPTTDDAQKSADFALALAEYLFVLPAKVERRKT